MIGGIRQRRRDLAQLAHSMNWFGENHDASCSATPVIIHQAVIGTNNATTPPATRVITEAKLTALGPFSASGLG